MYLSNLIVCGKNMIQKQKFCVITMPPKVHSEMWSMLRTYELIAIFSEASNSLISLQLVTELNGSPIEWSY